MVLNELTIKERKFRKPKTREKKVWKNHNSDRVKYQYVFQGLEKISID
jgi:hypothetical protein